MQVIVYVKPNCPPCHAVKRLLTREGIEFEERSAEDHADYLATLNARSAPVTVRGTTVVHGFAPDELRGLRA